MNPADAGRGHDHRLGPLAVEEAAHRLLIGKIELGAGPQHQIRS